MTDEVDVLFSTRFTGVGVGGGRGIALEILVVTDTGVEVGDVLCFGEASIADISTV